MQNQQSAIYPVAVIVGDGPNQETGTFLWTVVDRTERPLAVDDYFEVRWTEGNDGGWTVYLSQEQIADGWSIVIDETGQAWLRIPSETRILRNDYIPASTPTILQPEYGPNIYDANGQLVARFEPGVAGSYTGTILIRIPAHPGESFTARYFISTPLQVAQVAVATILVAHVPVLPAEDIYRNVGHHFFPVQLLNRYNKFLNSEAMDVALAMTSGDIGVHNGAPANGVTHAKYTEEVGKEFEAFLAWRKQRGRVGQLDQNEMVNFIQDMIQGRSYQKGQKVNQTILKYNQGILQKCRLAESVRPYKIILDARTDRAVLGQRVLYFLGQRSWKRRAIMIHAVLVPAIATVFTEAAGQQLQAVIGPMNDDKFQNCFMQAIISLQNGDLNTARKYLIAVQGSPDFDGTDSCLLIIQEKCANVLGLGFVQQVHRKIDAIFQEYEKYRNQNWNKTPYDWIQP